MHIRSIDNSNIPEFSSICDNMKMFLKVHHPACGHCLAMKNDWDLLCHNTKTMDHNAGIIELHADVLNNPEFKEKYFNLANKVNGYPTLMIVEKGGNPSIDYTGDRSYKDMLKFCKKNLFKTKYTKRKTKKVTKKKSGGKKRKIKKTKNIKK